MFSAIGTVAVTATGSSSCAASTVVGVVDSGILFVAGDAGSSHPDFGDKVLPGYDFVLQAESGLMSICGEPDGVPTKYGVAIVDICTGMLRRPPPPSLP